MTIDSNYFYVLYSALFDFDTRTVNKLYNVSPICNALPRVLVYWAINAIRYTFLVDYASPFFRPFVHTIMPMWISTV